MNAEQATEHAPLRLAVEPGGLVLVPLREGFLAVVCGARGALAYVVRWRGVGRCLRAGSC